jgi:hypothetical protein
MTSSYIDPFLIQTGLDQGCLLSPITYLFYNVNLIGLTDENKDMVGLGFVDNTAFAARGNTFEEANEKLKQLMEKEDRALRWGERYEAEYELEKTVLLCLTRIRKQNPNVRGKITPTSTPVSLSVTTR